MKLSPLLGLLVAGLAELRAASATLHPRDHSLNDYYVLHIARDVEPSDIAARLGLRHESAFPSLADHHVFSAARSEDNVVQNAIKKRQLQKRSAATGEHGHDLLDRVHFAQKQTLRAPLQKRLVPPPPEGYQHPTRGSSDTADPKALEQQKSVAKTLGIQDPIFNEQWHLFNPVQVGHDVNITQVWLDGITGKNATVAIIDDGLDMNSKDLNENYYAAGSYDFNDHVEEPKPKLSDDRHGTRCAGEIAAQKNDVCGVGVAWDSKVAGIRILSGMITDADEAIAMNYDFQHNDIYSCSWGPPDDGKTMDAPGILIRRAMLNGIQNGRDKLGSIFVFASGNGAASEDNCNFDGYTNSIYSITIGAVDRAGQHPYYSEKCSAQLVVTYSSGSGGSIVSAFRN